MQQIRAQGDIHGHFSLRPNYLTMFAGPPFLWHFVTLGAIRHHIWHNGIAETAFILIHKNWFAAMMRKVIFQITTKV